MIDPFDPNPYIFRDQTPVCPILCSRKRSGWWVLPVYIVIGVKVYICYSTISYYKVNRCLAKYSPRATTTNRPTNRALNKPAWPKLTKNANFGPNLVIFGQKILFYTGEIKSFVTHITENPPRHLVHIFFWSGIGQNVPKMAIFGPKWPKMQILDQIWPFLGQKS